jgi:hypothetical protein
MVSIALHDLIDWARDVWMRAMEFRIAIHKEGAILAEFGFSPRKFRDQFAVEYAH